MRTTTAAQVAAHSVAGIDVAFVEARLVAATRVLLQGRGIVDDDGVALALLGRCGAGPAGLKDLVAAPAVQPHAITATAWAVVAAVIDVVDGALAEPATPDHIRVALLDEAFERRRATLLARPPAAWAQLREVDDAFDAGLLDDAERVALREKILGR